MTPPGNWETQLPSAIERIERNLNTLQVSIARIEERALSRDDTNKRIAEVLKDIQDRLNVLERKQGIQGLFDLKDPSNILLWVLTVGWALGAAGLANPLTAIFAK